VGPFNLPFIRFSPVFLKGLMRLSYRLHFNKVLSSCRADGGRKRDHSSDLDRAVWSDYC
jgi:hypothetical protein